MMEGSGTPGTHDCHGDGDPQTPDDNRTGLMDKPPAVRFYCDEGTEDIPSPSSLKSDTRGLEVENALGVKSGACNYRELSRAHSPLAPDQECYLDEDTITPIASEDCTPVIDQSRFLIDSPTGVVTLNSPSVGLVTLDLDSCDEDEDSSKLETCCDEYDDLYSLDKYYTPDPSSTDLSVSSASADSLGLDETASKESNGPHLDSQSEGKQSTDDSFCDCVSTIRKDNSSQGSSLTTSLESEDNIYVEPPQHPVDLSRTGLTDGNRVSSFSEGLKGFAESLSECPMFCVPIVSGKCKSFSTSAIHTSVGEIGASEIKFSDRGIDTLDLKSTACEMSTTELKSLDRGRCKSCDVLRAQASDKRGHNKIRPPSLNLGGAPHAVPPGSGSPGGGGGTGDSPRSPGFCKHRPLDIPQTILDVNYDLLKSGIAILPGSRDRDGCAVVFIFTRSSLWQLQKVSSVELARTLLYYHSVPRDDVQKKGLKVVADIQGASSSTVNTLLETMYLLQGNCPGALSAVYMLANETSEPLVKKSPVYDPLATFRLEVLVSMETLHIYLPPESIPVALDGHYTYSHEDWIRFQMKLDPFVSKLQAAAKYLVCIMQDLTQTGGVPRTTKEANQLIEHHEQLIKSVFDDHRLMSVQTDGEGVINCLQREANHLSHSQDYRDSMMSMNKLYDNLQTTIVKLVRLSDSRLCKLEQCLQLREFEEECAKVLSWVSGNGEEFFQRYVQLADNLKAIRAQQKDFEKFYFSAMTHIEKGNDLLDEASMLAQSGNFDEVTGYKELARTLKKHLQLFTGRLEETRERIESTASCYHLLDKTYEWALDAMKYVASMKMEHCSTVEGLDKLLRSLQSYLRDHPMMKEETFVSMMDLAKKLRNEKLMEQCRVARARCEETHNLLTARQTTLQEAKDKMVLDTKTSPSKTDLRQSGQFGEISTPELRHPSVNNDNAVWQPCSASTPSSGSERTPSFCGSGTSPILPPANLTQQDMVFLGEGDNSFITEDMSDRVVASIPKILNNSTMRSSREDLTSPSETSSQGSARSVPTPQHFQDQGPGSAFTSHNRPLKKVLRRTSTAPPFTGGAIIEEEDSQTRLSDRRAGRQDDGRTVSMITSSTDSLSSMPEEEETENGDVSVSSSKSFTPVPVNSHLISQNGSIPTGSLADLKLSGTEKIKRTLAHVMREMIQTERDYVCSLQFIIDQYVPELERDDVPQALRGKRNVIFGNLEKIYHFHRQMFLREVELCEKNPFQIAQYFLMHASQFYLYAIYNKNKPKSDCLMAEYGKYFFREKQLQLGDKMDLSSYLLKPVQRMGKYALLIKQIMKACPHTDQEYQDLKAAEEMVKFQLRHGNDLLAMDSLRDCDVNLQEQGRLLRQEEFLVWQGRRKSMRHVFLFEDLILFSKTQRGRNGSPDTYHYKFSFKMADVGLTEAYEGSGYKFEIWFRRRSLGENYILQAPSSDVRHQWTKEISRVLWNQALKNRENHMTEMLSMGVGNKPCMDIKPSANNIQDRLLNYAVGNRGARTRNSVAVTSFEHLRQGNKRPHSIISVSSTSSSSSSHSGMVSILGPNLDMTDSPRSRQSIACMSNESGIGTDLSGSENDRHGSLEIRRGSGNRHYHPQSKLILSNTSSNEPVSTDV